MAKEASNINDFIDSEIRGLTKGEAIETLQEVISDTRMKIEALEEELEDESHGEFED